MKLISVRQLNIGVLKSQQTKNFIRGSCKSRLFINLHIF